MENRWALILGASSGFGAACGIALARAGMNIFGVHLDRRATLPNVERIIGEIEATGQRAVFFNANAADADKRKEILNQIGTILKECGDTEGIRVLLHSLAFGTLKPFIAETAADSIKDTDMDMTLDVMAHCLVYWTRDLVLANLMTRGARIFGMTSSGGHRVWRSYGAVSAAKAALESHIRQLAYELAPRGIAANSIRAGVTDTPALRKIPGNEMMIERAIAMNPAKRLTTTEDVATALVALCRPGIEWMTGNVLGVDGGEDITG
jgi:NAD(P)-dependent dehydrogenase (short-subunit alcohol dehydrogenase family)